MLWPSDLADELHKAKQYAREPERVTPCLGGWKFAGNNHSHFLTCVNGLWRCDCEAFNRKLPEQQVCAHTRAMEMSAPSTLGFVKSDAGIMSMGESRVSACCGE